MKIKVSIIIPVFKEESTINHALSRLKKIISNCSAEVIVVDGDISGSTVACIDGKDVLCLISPKGRTTQMNRGADIASGEILLFLHVDTSLPEKGIEKIIKALETDDYVGGAFKYKIESKNLFLKFLYYTSYLRSRFSRIPYGDQAIFIRRNYFKKMGGFPDIPIMEEVQFMKKIKKNRGKIRILKEEVKTSTRRYEQEGIVYGWLRNHLVRILFFFGVSPHKLVKYYPDLKRNKDNRKGLVIFLKYPQKGSVKTRLAKSIGDELTLELYKCFLKDMVEKFTSHSFQLHLFVSPAEKVDALRNWLDIDLPVHGQVGKDLGERLHQTFVKMFQMGYEYCVVMGSDFPDLPADIPEKAFEYLKTAPATIAPAADGGYYLIGFKNNRFSKSIFYNISWSTHLVFQQTMDILKKNNIPVKILPVWQDVDNLEDLKKLIMRNLDTNFKNSHTMKFLNKYKETIMTLKNDP